jgi:hypothetical protein
MAELQNNGIYELILELLEDNIIPITHEEIQFMCSCLQLYPKKRIHYADLLNQKLFSLLTKSDEEVAKSYIEKGKTKVVASLYSMKYYVI